MPGPGFAPAAGRRRERSRFQTRAWASTGARGRARGGQEIDLITSEQAWAGEAFAAPLARDPNGERAIPLAYLVLMKLDSARAIDQADLARVLGRLAPEQVEDVIRIVERHYRDPSAADDLRQYHEVGKWEYETDAASQSGLTDRDGPDDVSGAR